MHFVRRCVSSTQMFFRAMKPANSTLVSRAIATPPGKFINVDGFNIHYEQIGHGNHKVLFIIGAVGSTRLDYGELERMDPNKFTTIALDLPGYGFSRPPDRTFSIDYVTRDAEIAGKFVKALGISTLSVVGWCNGGCTAISFAAQNPQMMNKLVAVSCHSQIVQPDVDWGQKYRDVINWSPSMREERIQIYGNKYLLDTWGVLVDTYQLILDKKNGNMCAEEAKMVKCPTLILYGTEDKLITRRHIDILHKNINNSKLTLIEGARHEIPISNPHEFYSLVQSFLDK